MWALYRDLVRTAAATDAPPASALQAADAIALRRRLIDLEANWPSVVRNARQAKNQQRSHRTQHERTDPAPQIEPAEKHSTR